MFGNTIKELSGGEDHTTNNRMEMTGVIRALEQLRERCRVSVHSDSAYVINCFLQRWHEKWARNGWRSSSKQPVENRDLWEQLVALSKQHDVAWVKVKGHSDDVWNNRCDELARAESKKFADSARS